MKTLLRKLFGRKELTIAVRSRPPEPPEHVWKFKKDTWLARRLKERERP